MSKNEDKFTGITLTNGLSVSQWLNSFESLSERNLAEEALLYCMDKGYALSEIKLKLTMSSLKSSSTYQAEHLPINQNPQHKVIYVEHPRKKRGCIFCLVAFLLLLLVAFFSNPSLQKHQDEIKQTLRSIAQSNMAEKDEENPFVFLFGGFVIDKMIDAFVCSNLSYNNYFLFSTTSIDLEDGSKTISIGAFGKVFTFSKEDLQAAAAEKTSKENSAD